MTYAELKAALDTLSPEQLTRPVVWSGDEKGGYVKAVYIHDDDWIGDSSDPESWVPRREAEAPGPLDPNAEATVPRDPDEYEICIPKGTVHLHVD